MSQMPPQPGYASPSDPVPTRVTPASAWAGVTLGVLSLCVGVTAIFGLISSIFAMRVIKRDPARYTGSGLAVIGLVTSILGFLTLFALIGLVALGVAGFSKMQQFAAMMRASQLKMAVDQYAVTNDGTFPQPSDYRILIQQHVFGNAISDPPPLAMNSAFDSLDRNTTVDDRTVLFFEVAEDGPQSGGAESVTGKPTGRAGVLIVYLNGEAEHVAPDKIASLKWQPSKGTWVNVMANMQSNGKVTFGDDDDEDEDETMTATDDATQAVDDDFARGKAFYAKNKFAIAAKTLHKFVDENPKDARVGEARYFIAKSYESDPEGDRELAILAWQTYIEKHSLDNAARTDTARKHLKVLTGE